MVLEDAISKLKTFGTPCLKAHNLIVLEVKKKNKLGEMTNLKVIFYMVVSIYKLNKSGLLGQLLITVQ